MQPLEASVRHKPGVAIIDLHGDMDGDAEQVLVGAYTQAEQEEPAAILLNFAQAAYINSKGIALIVVLLRRAMTAGRKLLACGLSDHFREIFEITQLSNYIGLCAGEGSARTALQPAGVVWPSSREAPSRDEDPGI